MAGINGSMAHVSDTFFALAIGVYSVGMVSFVAEYSFGKRGRVATSSPARELVGAGGPPIV